VLLATRLIIAIAVVGSVVHHPDPHLDPMVLLAA